MYYSKEFWNNQSHYLVQNNLIGCRWEFSSYCEWQLLIQVLKTGLSFLPNPNILIVTNHLLSQIIITICLHLEKGVWGLCCLMTPVLLGNKQFLRNMQVPHRHCLLAFISVAQDGQIKTSTKDNQVSFCYKSSLTYFCEESQSAQKFLYHPEICILLFPWALFYERVPLYTQVTH